MESGSEQVLEDAYAEAALQWPDVSLEHLISDEDDLEDPAELRMRSAVEDASVYSLVSRLQGARSQESRSSRRLPDTLNLLRAAERLAAWAAAQRTRLVAEVYGLGNAANHSWSGEGDSLRFTEAATETAALLKLSEGAATRLVSESLSLTGHLQKTLTALEDGRICAGRTSVIVEQARTLPEEALPAFEREILESAPQLNRPKLAARCRRLREKLHPDTLSARRAQAFSDRRVVLEPAQDGMAWLSAYLPAEQAVVIHTTVDAAARNLRGSDESRTLAQLRADVFAETFLGGPANGTSGPSAKVLVTVPVFSLMGLTDEPAELEGYGPIPADAARELAANAPSFMRLLTHPYSGAVLGLDRTRYRPSEDLRTWVQLRDKTCSFYGCNRPASRCDIDHLLAWSDDGQTQQDNLHPLCRRHHMMKHQTDWRAHASSSGALQWTSPGGQIYTTVPDPPLVDPVNSPTVRVLQGVQDSMRAAPSHEPGPAHTTGPPVGTAPPF